MRKALEDVQVEAVTGGEVILSGPLGIVGFNAIGAMYPIKGDVKEMRNLLMALYDANPNMPDPDFDRLVMGEYAARGWI